MATTQLRFTPPYAGYRPGPHYWLTMCPVGAWVCCPNRIRAAVGTTIMRDDQGLFDKNWALDVNGLRFSADARANRSAKAAS